MTEKDEILRRLDEVKALYDITELEMSAVQQYIALIGMLGHSRKLSLRILKIVVALWEVIPDEK